MEDAPRHLKTLLDRCPSLEEVHVRRVTLDDVFLKFTGRQIVEGDAKETFFERIAVARTQR